MSLLSKLGVLFKLDEVESKPGTSATFNISITMDETPYQSRPKEKRATGRSKVRPPTHAVFQQEFTIVDIETTGLSLERDAIIEIAAVTVAPGFQIVAEYSTLIRTDAWIPHNIVEMTGITKADLSASGISLAQAIAGFVQHASTRPLFAHNAAFDIGFLSRAAELHGHNLDNPAYDSITLAKEAWPGLPTYKLGFLAEHLQLSQQPAHRAMADVRTTLELIKAAHETLSGVGGWTPRDTTSVAPPSRHSIAKAGNQAGPLFGQSITFTGELSMPREVAAELAAKAGCKVSPGVTKKTTLLVVGVQDLATLAGHQKSSKQRKAEELIAAGQPIRILTEADFLRLIAND